MTTALNGYQVVDLLDVAKKIRKTAHMGVVGVEVGWRKMKRGDSRVRVGGLGKMVFIY